MEATHVSLLVEQNLVAVVAIVVLADDDVVHPATGSHILGVAVDGDAILRVAPQATFADEAAHTGNLP